MRGKSRTQGTARPVAPPLGASEAGPYTAAVPPVDRVPGPFSFVGAFGHRPFRSGSPPGRPWPGGGGLPDPIGNPVDRLQGVPHHGDGNPERLVVDRL